MKIFNSYLIIGNPDPIEKKIKSITSSLKINIDRISPDIYKISPIKKNHISIEQIRDLKKHIFQKPLKHPYKIVIINEAHNLTLQAQSAPLKILEEPPKKAIIFLAAKNSSAFLPTITSRVVLLNALEKKQAENSTFIAIEENSLNEALVKSAEIDNYETWINDQIIFLNNQLSKKLKGDSVKYSQNFLVSALEKCARTKEMITANVNPKFALVKLILDLKLASI